MFKYKHSAAVAVKDMKEVFASVAIWGPMVGIPLFFAIVLPIFTVYVAQYAGPQLAQRLLGVVGVTGSNLFQESKLAFIEFFGINILGPIFLTMPIITASVIAADSFAGEKERKTAESMLSAPISNTEIIFGKVLASLVPTLVMTLFVFITYALIMNYLTQQSYMMSVFPNESWYLMLLNAPFLALTTIGLVVIISARVKGIKEAQQISALFVLPILVIPFISVFDVSNLTVKFFLGMLVLLVAASAVVLYIGVRTFNRERFISA